VLRMRAGTRCPPSGCRFDARSRIYAANLEDTSQARVSCADLLTRQACSEGNILGNKLSETQRNSQKRASPQSTGREPTGLDRSGWGPGGRRFKSCLPDLNLLRMALFAEGVDRRVGVQLGPVGSNFCNRAGTGAWRCNADFGALVAPGPLAQTQPVGLIAFGRFDRPRSRRLAGG
jgi:hypothetical protein